MAAGSPANKTTAMAIFGSLATVRAQMAGSPALAAAMNHVERCLTPGTDEHKRLMALAQDTSSD